jgi:PST family polysaccharide transporter
MLPVLARLQHEPERYRKAYIEAITLLMMVVQPGLVFSIVFAKDMFLILLGPQWTGAVPIFQWLGIAGLSQVLTTTLGWLFISQGRGGDFFKVGLFGSMSTVASFIVGLPWGPLGLAIAYTINNYVVLIPVMWWTCRRGPVSIQHILGAAMPHAVSAVASALVMVTIWRVTSLPSFLACAAVVLLSYLIYALVIILFPKKRMILIANLPLLYRLARL